MAVELSILKKKNRIFLIRIQKKIIDFHFKIEELRHKIRIMSFRLTSQISWCAYVAYG